MKIQRHDIYTSTQHVRLNAPPRDWAPGHSISSCGEFRGAGRGPSNPWIGVALSTVSYRELSGRRVSVPKGAEMMHWSEGFSRFLAYKLKSGVRIFRLEAPREMRRVRGATV
jgi:hypothetical protein